MQTSAKVVKLVNAQLNSKGQLLQGDDGGCNNTEKTFMIETSCNFVIFIRTRSGYLEKLNFIVRGIFGKLTPYAFQN